MRAFLGLNSLVAVIGAALLAGCATTDSVEMAQATANRAVASADAAHAAAMAADQKADQAGQLAQRANLEAGQAQVAANSATSAAQIATHNADDAKQQLAAHTQTAGVDAHPAPRIARNTRGERD
jgi:hypothetical protein